MAAVTSAIWGKEQLILLPVQSQVFTLQTDPPGQVLMQSGIHAVVASGYIGINPTAGGFGQWVLGDDDRSGLMFQPGSAPWVSYEGSRR